METLEARTLLSICTVDRLTDLGEGEKMVGDLRYCIEQAQDKDSIQFAVKGTINLTRVLPDLTRSVSIEGPGADLLTVRRHTGGNYRIFTVSNGAAIEIFGVTITNGAGGADGGGGILNNGGNVTLRDSAVISNGSGSVGGGYGGGIVNRGSFTVINSNISRNSAGGAAGFAVGSGGGIGNTGTLYLIGSTLSGNRALGGISDFGGAAYGGGISNEGNLAVDSTTFSQNYASAGGIKTGDASYGGAILNGGTAMVANSTIAANRAAEGDGIYNTGTLSLQSTTIWGNDLYVEQGSSNTRNTIIRFVAGNLGSQGHNLIRYPGGGSGYDETDLLNVDPLLGPLQDNGGPTFTHALLPGSPALDAGDNADAPEFDQRGLPRVVAGTIDIGAFEVQPGPATWFRLDASAEVAAGVPFDLTLSALDDYGHLATDYVGTVSFFTTDKDPGVLLPADYTFTADDQGVHTFAGETVLVTPGEQYLWALDTDGKVFGEAAITVVPGGAPGGQGGRQRTVLDWGFAADLARTLTRRAERADGFWAALPEDLNYLP